VSFPVGLVLGVALACVSAFLAARHLQRPRTHKTRALISLLLTVLVLLIAVIYGPFLLHPVNSICE
jgi:hypothetical protein